MDSPQDPLRKIPAKHAPDSRADIGTTLKAARAKKGTTLEAAAQTTRIPRKFLDALENNRFDDFPALAYLRGFLKNYCDYLELDFEPLWKDITAEPAKEPTPAPGAAAPVAAASKTPQAKPTTGASPSSQPTSAKVLSAGAGAAATPAKTPPKPTKPEEKMASHAKSAKPAAHDAHGHAAHGDHGHDAHAAGPTTDTTAPRLALLGLITALLGSIGYFASYGRPQAPTKTAATPAALELSKPPSEAVLVLTFTEDTWLAVSIDGAPVFTGKAPKGARQEWKSSKGVELKLSNPATASATLNGAAYTLPAADATGTIKIEAQ